MTGFFPRWWHDHDHAGPDGEDEFSEQRSRSLQEVQTAEQEFFDRVWYDRHQLLNERSRDDTPIEILEGAMKGAAEIEATYGKENLGPYEDFESGMINGKLSALRWVLGDDWDFLDT